MQIYEKNYKINVRKKYMSLTVCLQDRHRPTSKRRYKRPTNRCHCE